MTVGHRTAVGSVTAYDDHAGYGTVTGDDGRELWFHCTEIADGSRRVGVGTRVRFTVVPGHLGQWEAAQMEPLA
jgi:cold shock CspA family protein